MARESLSQSTGNPLQLDRLPATRPTLELRGRPAGPFETAVALFCWAMVLTGAGVVAWLIVRDRKALPMPPFAVIAAIAATVYWFVTDTKHSREVSGIAENLFKTLQNVINAAGLLGIAFLCLMYREAPPFAHELAAAMAVGGLARSLGQHFVGYSTTFPMRRKDAWRIRNRAERILRPLSWWPVGYVLIRNYCGYSAEMLVATTATCSLLAVFATRGQFSHLLSAPCHALQQWCAYNLRDLRAPGIFVGPSRTWMRRLAVSSICCFFVTGAVAEHSWNVVSSIAPQLEVASELKTASIMELPDRESRFLLLLWGPVTLSLGLPILLAWPILVYASRHDCASAADHSWIKFVEDIQTSPDSIERECIFIGFLFDDGSPVLIPRSVFKNHAHFLGDSGSGKTALGLSPWLEQMIQFGDSSFVVLDLKGDSLELFASMLHAAMTLAKRTGIAIPLKHFTTKPGRNSFKFNPMLQPFWADLEPYVKTDILCNSFGLNYGTEYGASWYTAANSEVCHQTITAAPSARSFRELNDALSKLLAAKGAQKMDGDLRSAGLHIQLVLKRLSEIEVLNPSVDDSPEIAEESIDLADLFQKPGMAYFQLPSMLMPTVAPEIARNVVYSLLSAAAAAKKRRCQVYLVIDEFQQILSDNLKSILQVARSMNVGVILANQSMQDLKTCGTDLIPALEANCQFRQWFAVSSSDDRARVVANSGETLEEFETHTVSSDNSSTTVSHQVKPRLMQNDVILATDHSRQSILCLKNSEGYAQYGGFSVVVESDYHISEEEYEQRRQMEWPEGIRGTFVPKSWRSSAASANAPNTPSGPHITTEFFGRTPPFRQEDKNHADELRRRSRKNGRRKPPESNDGGET